MSLSGGLGSAVAAERAINRYGRENVHLRFADTSWEDEDLYRFLGDLLKRWGGELATYRDKRGRTPLDVASERKIIPNTYRTPCSWALKIRPFERQDTNGPRPMTNLLGLDWREMHRVTRMQTKYAELASDGRYVDFPLLWKPFEFTPYIDVVRSWGIEPPRLYAMGFNHNNCGGRCVKQGQSDWLRLRDNFPERFAEVRDWEQAQRAKGGLRADYAIVAAEDSKGKKYPLPLAEIETRKLEREAVTGDDMFACFCGDGDAS